MKVKTVLLILVTALVALATLISMRQRQLSSDIKKRALNTQQPIISAQKPGSEVRVPAHYEQPPSLSSLGPTLSPEQFSGVTRAAYEAAKKIPQTIAQLPCYCHCDRSLGHKSLHSCFEDDHAAHCAVCVNEALTAYRLQTERKMTPAQIRQEIIAEYSNQ